MFRLSESYPGQGTHRQAVGRPRTPWHDLPRRYPPYQTCHRRFQRWQRAARLERLLQRLAEDLRNCGAIDMSEAFVDATFAGRKRGRCYWPYATWERDHNHGDLRCHGLPVAVHVASASPYEPHLVAATLDARFLADLPTRLIGDRGYDSDALDRQLMTTCGIEMIAAHRRGRRQSTQDGRCWRRARRRWKIERLFAWLHNSRRLVTRWERHVDNFLGMLHLACARILLRHL
jgi:transposase